MAERPALEEMWRKLGNRGYVARHEIVKLLHYAASIERAAGEREAELAIYRACANGRALEALSLLIEQFGGGNAENPWLGIMAGVALLKIDAEKLPRAERERDEARAELDDAIIRLELLDRANADLHLNQVSIARDLAAAREALEKYGAHLDEYPVSVAQGCTRGWDAAALAADARAEEGDVDA